MIEITRNKEARRVYLASPYHPDMPSRAKQIGGKWEGTSKRWRFDERDELRVRELAVEIFGTDGDDGAELVTLRVKIDDLARGQRVLFIAGREVAKRFHRDIDPQLGDGVIVVEGGFDDRGGSMKYPLLDPQPFTVLEVRDVPRPLAEQVEGAEIVSVDKPAACPLRVAFDAMGDDRLTALATLIRALEPAERAEVIR
jgi:hypothetical protein